jgi:hypothetical protein
MPKKSTKKKSKKKLPQALNKWNEFVRELWEQNPDLSYKEAMIMAKEIKDGKA